MTSVVVGALGAGAALWWIARAIDAESRQVSSAQTCRGGDLSATILLRKPLPTGHVHVSGRVTGPDGSGPLDPENRAVLFVTSRVAKVFECTRASECGVKWIDEVTKTETLPVFELHQEVTVPTETAGSGGSGALSTSPVLKQLLTGGGGIGPYRGAGIRERVQVDGTRLTLDSIVNPSATLKVDTERFTSASGAPDEAMIDAYAARASVSGSVDHIPPEHRSVKLGELLTERSINIGDVVHVVGTARPASNGVAIVLPTHISALDKDEMASFIASPQARYVRAAAVASVAAAAAAEYVGLVGLRD